MRRCPACSHPAYKTDRYCLACGHTLRQRWLDVLLVGGIISGVVGLGGLVRSGQGEAAGMPPPTPVVIAVAATPTPTRCRFVFAFRTLHDAMPGRVGACLENEHLDPASGDTVQHTTGGLLVWRKEGGAAFTDGARTWLLGATGIRERPNGERFPDEPNPTGLPLAGA